jgi:hypothetical protein
VCLWSGLRPSLRHTTRTVPQLSHEHWYKNWGGVSPGGHEPAFGLGERASERSRLAGGPHADGDQGGEQVGGDGEPRALGDVIDAADELQPQARPHETASP